MAPWTLSCLIFQALVLGVTSQEICPADCWKPHCTDGAAWNGGTPLVGDVCEHVCSKKFGETRYCGSSDKYAMGDSVNCTSCQKQAAVPRPLPAPKIAAIGDAQLIREAILEEARDRLENWYKDEDQMTLPYWESKAKVQQTKHWYLCDERGGNMKVPITFGEFNVSDVRPAQLFNVVADIEGQLKWDNSMSEVFQWMAFNASLEEQEYWFAVSSLNVEAIHKAENCLGAYWIRPCPRGGEKKCPSGNPYDCCPEGGSRIIFTTHINVHPPGFLNAKTMFDLSWTKQIDWIKALKDRAREVLKSNETFRAAQTPVLPKWLWQDPTEPTKGSVRFSFPHEMMIAPSKLYQRMEPFWSFPSTSPVLFVALAAAVSVLIFVAMRAHRALALIKETSDSRELLARRGHTSDMEHLFSRRFTSAETDLVEPGI